jgi:hypothetical protein
MHPRPCASGAALALRRRPGRRVRVGVLRADRPEDELDPAGREFQHPHERGPSNAIEVRRTRSKGAIHTTTRLLLQAAAPAGRPHTHPGHVRAARPTPRPGGVERSHAPPASASLARGLLGPGRPDVVHARPHAGGLGGPARGVAEDARVRPRLACGRTRARRQRRDHAPRRARGESPRGARRVRRGGTHDRGRVGDGKVRGPGEWLAVWREPMIGRLEPGAPQICSSSAAIRAAIWWRSGHSRPSWRAAGSRRGVARPGARALPRALCESPLRCGYDRTGTSHRSCDRARDARAPPPPRSGHARREPRVKAACIAGEWDDSLRLSTATRRPVLPSSRSTGARWPSSAVTG